MIENSLKQRLEQVPHGTVIRATYGTYNSHIISDNHPGLPLQGYIDFIAVRQEKDLFFIRKERAYYRYTLEEIIETFDGEIIIH